MTLNAPIGVFDSGVGGLTVYRALRDLLPDEDFVYLGDTARLPYGTKSKQAVEHYTLAAARLLRGQGVKYMVVACNTASAQALDALDAAMPDLPHCGVIAAGAEAAVRATRNGRIAVLATEGTVRSGAYEAAIRALKPDADVRMLPANLLVALAEEGWCDGAEAAAIVGRYLAMLTPGYDTLVLGCTHFPLLLPVLRDLCPPDIHIVDSATVTARAVADTLKARGLLASSGAGRDTFWVTDSPERFERLGARFLGRDIRGRVAVADISLLPLENAGDAVNSAA